MRFSFNPYDDVPIEVKFARRGVEVGLIADTVAALATELKNE